MGAVHISLFEMKVFLAISTLMVVAIAMPRYVLVPIEQIQFLRPMPTHHRVARSAWPQPPDAPGAFVIPDAIRANEDNLSSGSSPGYANAGPDYVLRCLYWWLWSFWLVYGSPSSSSWKSCASLGI